MIMVAEPDQDLNNNPLEAYVALLRSKGASTKDINLRKSVPFIVLIALVGCQIAGQAEQRQYFRTESGAYRRSGDADGSAGADGCR